jgi:hypothetical protein
MNRLLGGGLALGLAAVASIALATPGLAEPPFGPPYTPIDGQLSTDVVAPGGTITASSLEPCSTGPGVLHWAVYNERVGTISSGDVPIGEDGAWTLDFAAPTEPGEHRFLAMCPPFPGGPPATEPTTTTTAPVDPAAGIVLSQYGAEYYYLTFVVTAPPASPVVARPTFTG